MDQSEPNIAQVTYIQNGNYICIFEKDIFDISRTSLYKYIYVQTYQAQIPAFTIRVYRVVLEILVGSTYVAIMSINDLHVHVHKMWSKLIYRFPKKSQRGPHY